MCIRCDEINRKVERNNFLASQVLDSMATKAIGKLTRELLVEKAALHRQRQE
jgi:hypothetical protein